MTSKEHITQLVDEDERNRVNLKRKSSTEEGISFWKTVHCNNHLNW